MKSLLRAKFCGIMLLGLLLAGAAWAQEPDSTKALFVQIILKDGTTVGGVIVKEDADVIHLRAQGGVEIRIPRDQIREMNVDSPLRRSRYFPDPARSRLFIAPTGRSLGHLAGYGALYEIFFPALAVGLADHLTLVGGFSLIPGASTQAVYAAPKLTIVERERVAVALGVTALTTIDQGGFGGLFYGVGTLGSEDQALTLGVGLLFDEHTLSDQVGLLVGGELRVADTIKLLTENYFFSDIAVLAGGTRLLGRTFSADLGLATTPEAFSEGGFPFVPWLGFNIHFGRR